MKKLLSLFITVVVVVAASYYVKKNPEEFVFMQSLSLYQLIILLLLSLVTMFFMGLKTKIYMEFFSIRLRFIEWFGLEYVVSLINYLPFRPGLASKALYLKNTYSFPYANFASFLAAINLISLLCIGITGLLGMGVLYMRYSIVNEIITGIFAASTIMTLAALFFPLKTRSNKTANKLLTILFEALRQWNQLKKSKITVVKLFLIESAILFSSVLRLYVIFRIITASVPFSSCIIIASLASLSTFLPLTPAGLGIKETAISITTKLVGNELKAGITASLLDRAISMVILFLLGGIFFQLLFTHKKTGARAPRVNES